MSVFSAQCVESERHAKDKVKVGGKSLEKIGQCVTKDGGVLHGGN